MASFFDKLNTTEAVAFADKVGEPFKSIPNLPKGLVEFLVKITPYFALLGALMYVIVAPLGAIGSVFALLTLNPVGGLLMLVSTVLMLVSGILMFMAFKPLQEREHKGWMYLFWSEMLMIASTVLGILDGAGFISGLIGGLIGLYILFQMRPFYNPMAEVVAKTVKE